MDAKKFKILTINSCLQNGKQNTSLAENRDSNDLTAILKGARQGIHNWKKEKKICCRRHSFITTHLQFEAWRLEGTKCTKEREFLIQFNIPFLVQSYYRYYCRAGLFVSKCGWSLQISPLEVTGHQIYI
jgi:hypothetical protein